MNDNAAVASQALFDGTTHDASGRPVADAERYWRDLIDRHGPEQAAALGRGDFAVALTLQDGSVFMAVDRFAIRTLCYCVDHGAVRFARRADELASAVGAPIDLQALYDYLYSHVIASPRTVFRDVLRLPAGHYAIWRGGSLQVRPYWRPDFSPQRVGSFAALKDEFQALLARAVQRQLDGTKPACFLSGGTDSSTIAGMIARVAGKQVSTYSIGFEAEGYDEMSFARIAAHHFDADHHEYYVTPSDIVRSLPGIAAHFDQPFGNSSALPAFYCARMARDDGVSRLLAGDGGDELFGGNTRYAKQRVFGIHDDMPDAIKALIDPLFDNGLAASLPAVRKVASYIRQANIPMPNRMQTYNLLRHLGEENVLTPVFLRGVNIDLPKRQQREVWKESEGANLLNRQLAYDWRYTLAECDLPKVCGTAEMANVAVGFPMLDAELVDFSLRLPASYKLKGMQLRWFFKEALRGFLPDEVIAKKKHGFGLPFGVWVCRDQALNRMARDSLSALEGRGVVQAAFVKSLMDERLAEHAGYYGEMVWILTVMEQWLRHHVPDFQVAR